MTRLFCHKVLILFIVFNVTIIANLLGQSNFEAKINEIDIKLDNWQHKEAKEIFDELNKTKLLLNKEEKYALDLRQYKIEYFVNNDDTNFETVLNRIDELQKINNPKLEYNYLCFIGEVYKTSFNFKNAFLYYNKALKNAENRNDTLGVIYSSWNLGNFYYKLEYFDPRFHKNEIDSTLFYYNKVLKLSKNKNNIFLPRIYNNLGRIETKKENYIKAEKYINKALYLHYKSKDSFGISISFNNLSDVYFQEKNYRKSISNAEKSNNFIKNKSLRIKRNNLKNIAKSNSHLNNFEDSYKFLNKAYNLTVEINEIALNNNVNNAEVRYKVIKEQKNTLREKNKRLLTQLYLYILLFVIIILVYLWFKSYQKSKENKKKFVELIKNRNNHVSKKISEIKIHKKVKQKILVGLKKFEEENDFLSQNISLNKLAKKLQTNPKYLSLVVNSYKKKNFSTYLNDLRIDYIVSELQINKELHKYTIEAIAVFLGYKNTVSFSSAFKKKTGLTPFYFIEQVKKKLYF